MMKFGNQAHPVRGSRVSDRGSRFSFGYAPDMLAGSLMENPSRATATERTIIST